MSGPADALPYEVSPLLCFSHAAKTAELPAARRIALVCETVQCWLVTFVMNMIGTHGASGAGSRWKCHLHSLAGMSIEASHL